MRIDIVYKENGAWKQDAFDQLVEVRILDGKLIVTSSFSVNEFPVNEVHSMYLVNDGSV
ncbi:MAG: hypothetical protein ACTSQA_01175 [Candidatus Heimdallarchaeaceae archaeon]